MLYKPPLHVSLLNHALPHLRKLLVYRHVDSGTLSRTYHSSLPHQPTTPSRDLLLPLRHLSPCFSHYSMYALFVSVCQTIILAMAGERGWPLLVEATHRPDCPLRSLLDGPHVSLWSYLVSLRLLQYAQPEGKPSDRSCQTQNARINSFHH